MENENEIIPTEEAQEPERKPEQGNFLALLHTYRRFIIGGVLGIMSAVLFMILGFWKTVFILAMAGLGAFLFGVDDKVTWLKNLLNKLFPPKS